MIKENKRKKQHFHAFTCLRYIEIAFTCFEIFSQTADGMMIKVLETRFPSVLKITIGDKNSGKILYIVSRGQANKTRKNAF